MAMTLTGTQMFLGAVSIGIAMLRGSSVYTQFHHETLVGHASYGSSKTATDHARAANIVVNDNVIMAAIMGPRFGVEADNITMDANAAIACPTCPKSPKCEICRQYKQNKPRALAKLVWVRAKQKALWGTLGKLSGDVDRLAAMQASSIVSADIARIDPRVQISFDDPSLDKEIWGGGNAAVACKLAAKDTLVSPVLGHAFPLLIRPNLLEGLPKVLVQAFPQMLCAAADSVIELPEIKDVADKTRDDCRAREDEMRCAVAAKSGNEGSCRDFSAPTMTTITDGRVELPSGVQPFITCKRASPEDPINAASGGWVHRDAQGQVVTCTFDREKCQEKALRKNSEDYLKDKLALPKVAGSLAASLGGSETRRPTNGARSADFCACARTTRPVNETILGITDAVHKIASFGTKGPSEALRRRHEYHSCGRWYFPDGRGEFAGVPRDEQPFVAAWKSALVLSCDGLKR